MALGKQTESEQKCIIQKFQQKYEQAWAKEAHSREKKKWIASAAAINNNESPEVATTNDTPETHPEHSKPKRKKLGGGARAARRIRKLKESENPEDQERVQADRFFRAGNASKKKKRRDFKQHCQI